MADACIYVIAYRGRCTNEATHDGRCLQHIDVRCHCGALATHECSHTGQFVCGAPLCDDCEGWEDPAKAGGAWGFMNHSHRRKPSAELPPPSEHFVDATKYAVDALKPKFAVDLSGLSDAMLYGLGALKLTPEPHKIDLQDLLDGSIDVGLEAAKAPALCQREACHRHGCCICAPCFLDKQTARSASDTVHASFGGRRAGKTAEREAAQSPTDRSLIVAINATGVFWSPGAVRESAAAPEIDSPLARSIYAHALALDRFSDLASMFSDLVSLTPPPPLNTVARDDSRG
jgi:hypothetical protein